MYCEHCKIKYDADSEMYNDEYIRRCPMCEIKNTVNILREKLSEANFNLNRYRICEKCQNFMGDCDMDRDICDKLKLELSKL